MPGRLDTSPLFATPPPSAGTRGLTHLSTVLDAMMARKQAEELQRAQLAQQRELAGVDDAREQRRISEDSRLRTEAGKAKAASDAADMDYKNRELAMRQRQGMGKAMGELAGQGEQAFAAGAGALGRQYGAQVRPALPPPARGFGASEDPALDEIGAVDSVMDYNDQRARDVATKSGKYQIDYGQGQVEEFDPRPMGPEARAEQIERQFAGLPRNSPAIVRAIAEAKAAVASGAIKPEDTYQATVGQVHKDEEALKRARAAAAAKLPPSIIYGPGGGKLATAPNPKDAPGINKTIDAARQFNTIIKQLRDSYAKGRVLPTSKEAGRRKSLMARAGLAIKNSEELGALVGPDWGLIHDQIGSGDAWMYITDPTPNIDQALASSAEKLSGYLDSHGLPGQALTPQILGDGPGGDIRALEAEADAALAKPKKGRR